MNAAEYFLPPNDVYRKTNNAEAEAAEVRGYLEIEVSRINFITVKSKHAKSTSAIFKNQREKSNQIKLPSSVRKKILTGGVAVKVIWWGEQEQSCAKVKSTLTNTTSKSDAVSQRKNHKQRSSHHSQNQRHHKPPQSQPQHQHHHQKNKQREEDQKQQSSSPSTLVTQQLHTKRQTRRRQTDKLRYGVRTSLALFLDYLRECPPIEIVATTASVSANENDNDQVPLGQTQLPLPALLVQKYAENYVNGCNFEYKTKIYALYRHVKSGAASCQVQQQQQLKTGEIQLRFKMLFTSAVPPPTATANRSNKTAHALKLPSALLTELPGKMTAATVASWQANGFAQQQSKLAKLTVSKRQEEDKHNHQQQQQKLLQQQQESDGNSKSITTRPAGKSGEIMDAMKKLDANLAALLAAENDVNDPVAAKSLEQLKRLESGQNSTLSDLGFNTAQKNNVQHTVDLDAAQQLALFKRVDHLKLQLEALTLQAEGTKRMELLQSEIRPIFTVECQLSQELIKTQPRYDMFNIMQFESEKFQSLTQCTRFGQEDQRAVQLQLHECENGNAGTAPDLGRIHFTVWWREPGTCLNEMLGLGTLDISELYNDALLEQCKCIAIHRRGVHLASLYLKISLQSNGTGNFNGSSITDSDTGGAKQTAEQPNPASTCAGQAANNNNNGNGNGNVNNNNTNNDNADQSNNNPEQSSNNFTAETSKVRLLRGFIAVNETRQLQIEPGSNVKCSLVCQPFWQQQQIAIDADANNAFNFQEQFSIINDDKFLKCVDRQHLQLAIQPLGGIVRLPLHQFFIAYRDASITNHLCKTKLPVISIDCWAPIVHTETAAKLGEVRCLLAIGSEPQIAQLKELRGFGPSSTTTRPSLDNQMLRRTTDLLDMLQSALTSPRPVPTASVPTAPFKPLQTNKLQTFKFILTIAAAAGLPLNPGVGKGKKSGKRQTASKRFTPNEPPSTYVTFQADDCNGGQAYKSHEGEVFATKIVEKSTEPQWQSKFRVTASVEYLTNPQKLFILKIWKKAATETGESRQEPTPLEDAIIGFAALNLNLKTDGSNVGGWHNIVDFNGRINGGLEVYIQPLEDVHKLLQQPTTSSSAVEVVAPAATLPATHTDVTAGPSVASMDAVIDNFEQTLDLAHLNLGQAIKRKFNELEQISQRLRSRLVDVTGEPFASKFDTTSLDDWQPLAVDTVAIDDDDFERDLMTPPPASPSNPAAQTSQQNVDGAAAMTQSKSSADDGSPNE